MVLSFYVCFFLSQICHYEKISGTSNLKNDSISFWIPIEAEHYDKGKRFYCSHGRDTNTERTRPRIAFKSMRHYPLCFSEMLQCDTLVRNQAYNKWEPEGHFYSNHKTWNYAYKSLRQSFNWLWLSIDDHMTYNTEQNFLSVHHIGND